MRALQLSRACDPVEAIELPAARPGPGEVRVAIEAAGICHSDVHYRAGLRRLDTLPVVLGHETAGTITEVGEGVAPDLTGTRVGLHYVISCGTCLRCELHGEQFCDTYGMLGVTRQGGFADSISVPARNAIPIPDVIPTSHAAVMMCSTATALHALHQGRLEPGQTVAVFGVGGLGMSAVQLARALGAAHVVAVDVDETRLAIAADLGADPVPANQAREALAAQGGADLALDLVGSMGVLRDAIDAAPPGGRVVSVGLTHGTMALDPFADLIRREVELIGSNDHLAADIHELFAVAENGELSLDQVVTGRVPLDPDAVNEVMDVMQGYGPGIRTVIEPQGSSD
jgi:propanol-preferring alcohol dehydrogenase